ncbi:uncharacterized protein TNCV_2631601 [Trichonephila clavipes]|nr:uncharacterized protein TNCV_2631601 [Trichonephila clavipes]
MAEYTNAEKVDMILAYEATDCNGRAAQRLYAERRSCQSGLLLIPCLLAYTSNYVKPVHSRRQARNRDRTARTELNEEIVLDMVHTTPSLGTRGLFTVVLAATNCKFLLQPAVLFTDEASFREKVFFNTHNSHSWAAENPHVTRTRAAHGIISRNYGRYLGDHLIGPYILPDRLTGPRYLIFLEQVLPELLDSAHVTAATVLPCGSSKMEPPQHFSISVRNHLDATCGER